MLMGKPIKRELGVSVGWIGGRVLTSGLLGYISEAKQARTLEWLAEADAAVITVDTYERLVGMLNHLVCLLAMPYHVMYGMYSALDEARAQGLLVVSSKPPPLPLPHKWG